MHIVAVESVFPIHAYVRVGSGGPCSIFFRFFFDGGDYAALVSAAAAFVSASGGTRLRGPYLMALQHHAFGGDPDSGRGVGAGETESPRVCVHIYVCTHNLGVWIAIVAYLDYLRRSAPQYIKRTMPIYSR